MAEGQLEMSFDGPGDDAPGDDHDPDVEREPSGEREPDAERDPDAESRRARLVVAYDGSGFRGFAPNHGVRTVMGELLRVISMITGTDVDLTGAGRTDAGVHAWGQVVSGDLPADTDLESLARRVNKLLRPAVAIRTAEWVEPDFDARFSATWRRYRYHVWNDPAPNPLLAGLTWHVPEPLSLPLLRLAVAPLIGEHDFDSFCRRPKVPAGEPPASLRRRVLDMSWSVVDDTPLLRLEIRGTAFCHQMVRSITGTLVDVGRGRLTPADVTAILHARDRRVAGSVAPPQGLVLWAVGYDGTRWDAGSRDDPPSADEPRPI